MTSVAIALVIVIILILYYVTTKNFNYWKNKNVPYATPTPLFGNYVNYITLREYYGQICQKLCQRFPDQPYFGTFYGTAPALVVKDPEIIKLVYTKDFYYFNSRELMEYSKREVTTQNLFFAHGDRWKVVRQNLTPLFSSTKMKNMFYLIAQCAFKYEEMLDHETSIAEVLDVRALSTRYIMDCICSCVFGIEANTQSRDAEKSPFSAMGEMIFDTSYYRGFKNAFRVMWPKVFYGLGMKLFPKEINVFFHNMLVNVFQSRQNKPSPRNDFVDFLMTFKNKRFIVGDSISNLKEGKRQIELEVDDELLVAQCVAFFGAGFETSATFASLTIYELAKDPGALSRAQTEVDEYLKTRHNKLDYDCVTELPFLDACVSETLRLYPILGILAREVVENYTFPSGLQVDKGVRIHLPLHYIHRDPRNFPEPDQFKPERFLPDAIHEIKPYTYFPFGEGPRTCIGLRFAKMQTMPGLIAFLKKFSVELAEGTPSTLQFETKTLLLQPASELKLKLIARPGWKHRLFARETVVNGINESVSE